jgi:hypothetical protein
MKNLIAFTIFLATFAAQASEFKYDVDINDAGEYTLNLVFDFTPGVTMQDVKRNFKSETLLNKLETKVDHIILEPPNASEYTSTMYVKSMGLTSILPSKCHEAYSDGLDWTRACELQVQEKDAGKYMVR